MSGRSEFITSANLYGVWQSPHLGTWAMLVWWPEGLSLQTLGGVCAMISDGMFLVDKNRNGRALSPLPLIRHYE